ncbi:MAG TPA: hypothetical protein GXZ79_01800 [Acholeplasma sp.]|nr:hypothetical protein [Acholeplasma sp.]
MKSTQKFKNAGFIVLSFALVSVILAFTVFSKKRLVRKKRPDFVFLGIGMFSFVLSLPLLVTGFSPQIAKVTSKIQSETIDYAKEDIEEAVSKRANTIIPAVTPSLKHAYKEIKDEKSIEDKLEIAQSLLDRKLITEEEYKQMGKNILGIK